MSAEAWPANEICGFSPVFGAVVLSPAATARPVKQQAGQNAPRIYYHKNDAADRKFVKFRSTVFAHRQEGIADKWVNK
jgi:hypothetical protein